MIQKIHKKLQACLIPGFCFLLFVFCLLLIFHFIFRQKIYPGIKVANVNLTSKTQEQAVQILKGISLKQKNKLQLKFENQVWEVSLVNLEFAYLSENTSKKAYLIGRSGNLKKDFIEKIKGMNGKINLDFEYKINQSLLETTINNIAEEINIPPIPHRIQMLQDKITGSKIEIQKGQSGRKVEQKMCSKYANAKNLVIATGGGVILNPKNMKALKINGVNVFLFADPNEIIRRITKQAGTRPSLTGKKPEKEIYDVWHKRRDLYLKYADFVWDNTSGKVLGENLDRIFK